jgi:putative molybdopterin biosynthesis protein
MDDVLQNRTDHAALLDRVRRASRQEQLLDVLPAGEVERRFRAATDFPPLPAEMVPLAAACGRVVAKTVHAAADAPPFDRASLDGFALRAADTGGATEAPPRLLRLNPEVLACGAAPSVEVALGTATAIATGGVVPRGADAVVMVEHTEFEYGPDGPVVPVRRTAAPGGGIAFAGSAIARGEALLRTGSVVTSREIGMLAADGLAAVPVVRRPRVAVLSTGGELVPPGSPLPTGGIYDSNAAVLAAAVAGEGGEAVPLGILPDDEAVLEATARRACWSMGWR